MTLRKFGITIVLFSSVLLFLNRFTTVISDFFGKLFCGREYMQPINGIIGDHSCGFNADMYVALVLTATTMLGIVLIFVSKKNRV